MCSLCQYNAVLAVLSPSNMYSPLQSVHLPCIEELHYNRRNILPASGEFPFVLSSSTNLRKLSIRFFIKSRDDVWPHSHYGSSMDPIAQWTAPAQCQTANLSELEMEKIDFNISEESLRHLASLERLKVSNGSTMRVAYTFSCNGASLLLPFRRLTRYTRSNIKQALCNQKKCGIYLTGIWMSCCHTEVQLTLRLALYSLILS